ncbi:MAG: LysR substrate-binding domain-containing protein [Chitinophagaceae bacterium]
MELRQLKYFLKAQELLSFTEAAHSLHITQSTLSQQIRQLETELGTPLFNRLGRQVTLTEAGRLFVDFAVQSVQKAEEGALMIRDLHNLHTGTVSIGVAYGLRDFFTGALISFASQYPDINVRVVYEPSHVLFEKLDQFELDFILAFHESAVAPHFRYQRLFSSPMILAASPATGIAGKKRVSLEEICQLPLAIATKGYNISHIISQAFQKNKLTPQFKIEVNDIPTVLQLVKTGKWYSILVQTSIIMDDDLVAIPINNKSLTRVTKIISLKNAYETNAVKVFKKILVKAIPTAEL